MHQVFVLRLKPGALPEYTRHHDEIPTKWPELAQALRDSGVLHIRTYDAGNLLILSVDVTDENAFPRLWDTPAHKEWAKVMDPLIELDAEQKPDARFLTQIFNFEA